MQFRKSILALAILAAASTASARDWRTAEVHEPQGHQSKVHSYTDVSFGIGQYQVEDFDEDSLFRLHVHHHGKVHFEGEFSRIEPAHGHANGRDVQLKLGAPIDAYPVLQVIPYGSYGYRKVDAHFADLSYHSLGVGVLAQGTFGAWTLGLDLGASMMLDGEINVNFEDEDFAIHGRAPLGEELVKTVRLSADWNIAGPHHLKANYTMSDVKLSVEDLEESFDEKMLFIGYAFRF